MNQKLAWFAAIDKGIDLSVDEYAHWYNETLIPEQDRLWGMLDRLNDQVEELQGQIDQFDYEEFAMKNRHASEDQRAAEEDKQRQTAWLEDAQAEITAFEAERDALKGTDGVVSAENQSEYDRLDGLVNAGRNEADRL